MNAIAGFRLCKLSDIQLIERVNDLTDKMFQDQQLPTRHIPARPDADYDLLVGELLLRFMEKSSIPENTSDNTIWFSGGI